MAPTSLIPRGMEDHQWKPLDAALLALFIVLSSIGFTCLCINIYQRRLAQQRQDREIQNRLDNMGIWYGHYGRGGSGKCGGSGKQTSSSKTSSWTTFEKQHSSQALYELDEYKPSSPPPIKRT
ncbi:hypothetical protein QBC35DRAFT_451266 [Podospora australis]|uniref:Uncharacterized protein n=1 Tax=Podospora australis TaxID=1536484 RepID=A0AAN7AH53_9PEZI|nr:hypothetical protein QBC35DRAFT_451266 [Podospora australis]